MGSNLESPVGNLPFYGFKSIFLNNLFFLFNGNGGDVKIRLTLCARGLNHFDWRISSDNPWYKTPFLVRYNGLFTGFFTIEAHGLNLFNLFEI